MPVSILMGAAYGDEGKGHVGAAIARHERFDAVMKVNGGANAGHTVVHEGQEIDTHLLPASGILLPNILNIIGAEVLFNPIKGHEEIERLAELLKGGLVIDYNSHVVFPYHVALDTENERRGLGNGSTKNGIAQTMSDKTLRKGFTIEDVLLMSEQARSDMVTERLNAVYDAAEEYDKLVIENTANPDERERLRMASEARLALEREQIDTQAHKFSRSMTEIEPFVDDAQQAVYDLLENNGNILIEGSQSHFLGLDTGIYPYTTSSNTSAQHLAAAAGVPMSEVRKIYGTVKAFTTRVGEGPLGTEILDENLASRLRGEKGDMGAEYGTTTGRARRMGRWDWPMAFTAFKRNGVTDAIVTKLDILREFGPEHMVSKSYIDTVGRKLVKLLPRSRHRLEKLEPTYQFVPTWTEDLTQARSYEEFPDNAKKLIDEFERETETPTTIVSAGPHQHNIHRRQSKLPRK